MGARSESGARLVKRLIPFLVTVMLAGCAPTPFETGEADGPPLGYVLCKEDRPDECD